MISDIGIPEAKHLVEAVTAYNMKWTENSSDFDWSVFGPIVVAIAENNKTVIDYLDTCDEEIRQRFYHASDCNKDNLKNCRYVGLFWYIDDYMGYKGRVIGRIIFERFDLEAEIDRAENTGSGFITPLISHSMIWASKVKEELGSDKDYTYYPRGRVNYNATKDIYELDMDSCLHGNTHFLCSLFYTFNLDEQKAKVIPANMTNTSNANYKTEGHYWCHNCIKKYG
jgi:hypothetical protein